MSVSKIYSAQATLLNAQIIDIEVDLSRGLHSFSVVGLADKSVDESKDRVSAAIKNSGWKSPKNKNQKVVVSLAPADVKKLSDIYWPRKILKRTWKKDSSSENCLSTENCAA